MCQLVVDLNFELMYWFRHLYFSIVIFLFQGFIHLFIYNRMHFSFEVIIIIIFY